MSKLPGIASLISVALLITTVSLMFSNSPPKSIYIKWSIALFVLSISVVGSYLIRNYCGSTKKMAKIQIYVIAAILAIFGFLVSFNIVDFLDTYNWLISLGIVFVTLVELQLLNWGDKTGSIVKISSILLLLSNLFLIVFFITEWDYSDLSVWINTAITVSLLSFAAGISFLPNPHKAKVVIGEEEE